MKNIEVRHCVICGKEIRRFKGKFQVPPERTCCSYSCCGKLSRQKNAIPLSDRIWKRIKIGSPNECWEWQGPLTKGGYGYTSEHHKYALAHRIAYRLAYGVDPGKLFVCHKCDNRRCCNPNHLFLGTQKDNMMDRNRKGRQSHLGSNGHQLIGEKNPTAKLTAEQVKKIRREYTGKRGEQSTLARKYGVTYTTIHYVILRKSWRSV